MNAHDPTDTESDPYPHNDIDRHLQSHARFARAAPSPEVIAAAQFLLQQPDAYLYRRRILKKMHGHLLTRDSAPQDHRKVFAARLVRPQSHVSA